MTNTHTMDQAIINLTPDTLNVLGRVISPSGMVARVSEVSVHARDHAGVRLEYSWPGEVIDLPAPCPGTLYIVSDTVRTAVPHRSDVASPGKLVRDDEGRVLGCASLVMNPPLGSVRPADIDKSLQLIARRD